MLDMGDRELTLQYMTDRFKEEGSVRSFVDSLGYDVDLNSVTGEKESVLAKEDCEGLMSLIDHDLFSKVEVQNGQDMNKFIDESELVSVIGKVKMDYCSLTLCPSTSTHSKYNSYMYRHISVVFIELFFFFTRTNLTPCLTFTKKLSGLTFLSRLSLSPTVTESQTAMLSSSTTPTSLRVAA